MTNIEIAHHFSLLADLLEIHGENPFKIKSYTNAAGTIEDWPLPLTTISDDELYQIPGIGQAIGEKVRELQQTGNIKALQKVVDITPVGIIDMLKIAGLSSKKIGVIWRALGTETIDALETAALENRIAPLKGFGAKTQEGITQAIAFYKANLGYFMWAKAEVMMLELIALFQKAFPENKFEPTGAMRRQEDVINMIDLITNAPIKELEKWGRQNKDADILISDDALLQFSLPKWPIIFIRYASTENFFFQQFLTTGSEEFLTAFQENYAIDTTAESEEAIFEKAGIELIAPPMRMNAHFLAKAENKSLPTLIQPSDVKGLIHCHSTYSDGAATLAQMATSARDKGLEYMVISDHSQAAQYASGLYPDKIIAQHQEIDALNKEIAPFKIFKSIEADILPDGNLDYNPKILSSFDLVITSVHSNLKMTEDKAMTRLLKAIENPFTTILGHMTGRLLLRRAGYSVNHKKVIDACAANNVVIEINANPRRLDIDWTWIQYALEKGALLSIDPDAHSIAGIDDIRYGVIAAQKGGLTAKDNLSSYSLAEFEAFLEKTRQKR